MSTREQIKNEARWMLAHKGTVRSTGKEFNIPKSTIHKHMTDVLPTIDPILAVQIFNLLGINKAEKHIRGGAATSKKYAQIRAARAGVSA